VYGLIVARVDVRARLADGQLRTEPIDVAVSEGRLTLAPLVRLNAKPADIVLPRGPLLTDVHLSPELCQRGLRFIAPVLADSTVADGRLSISLDGGRFPLADPMAGDISGHLAMRAEAHPGPIAREFLVLIKELTSVLQRGSLKDLTEETGALVSVNESNIDFRCINRRVYHRGLRFTVGTTPITTYGWVGFDDTLGIVAEVPIQAKLFGIDLSLGTLEGQVLQIPINGTLDDPQLDKRALTQLTGRMLENTARGALLNGVEKQLERLLPGKP
jgi:translocation and assembly module TamB